MNKRFLQSIKICQKEKRKRFRRIIRKILAGSLIRGKFFKRGLGLKNG